MLKGRFLSFILTASIVFSLFGQALPALAENSTPIVYGDVNGDNAIDSADFTLLRQYLLGKISVLPVPIWKKVIDLNQDGVIDSADYSILRRFLLGKINKIPVVDSTITPEPIEKIDDWAFSSASSPEYYGSGGRTGGGGGLALASSPSYTALPSASSGSTIGFSTGGAKDVNNFRENIKNNYFPQNSSLTYEGLFYDYYFDTAKQEETNKLFSPSYTYAISKDPVSGESEYYMSVGLNSGMKQEDFKRKKLNLTVVLDISGSMASTFDSYYYNNPSVASEVYDKNKTKLQIASESVAGLLGHLNADDRFGMVLFDQNSYLGKPLNLVGKTDMEKVKKHILELQPQGSTNFEAGYKLGTKLYDAIESANPAEYENRIIFLTDAMPNTGSISEDSLLKLTEKNAQNKIYTTFIGIGVDFNTDLVEYITKTKGANYYSVHSSKEFKTRMDDEFEYMVTPLVFDLQLKLESKGYKIEKVYGSPEANESTGEIMKVNTLFPSKTTDGETKGGIVLLKLKKISDDAQLTLSTSYEDRNGNKDKDTKTVTFGDKKPDFYENTGIRKGIVLTRYANILKNWLVNEAVKGTSNPVYTIPVITDKTGIIIPDELICKQVLSKWEHQSVPLKVSQEYKNLFNKFIPYMESEIKAIGDDTMSKEVDLLKKLSGYSN